MSSTNLSTALVMDRVASLMNDTAKSLYTYQAQLPYLNIAFDELETYFQLNNVPVTDQTSATITIPAGITQINPVNGPLPTSPPNYPSDLVEIQNIRAVDGTNVGDWIWQDQRIKFTGSYVPAAIVLDYIKRLFQTELDENSVIGIINAESFLYFRTGSLCSLFIGENKSRADELTVFASDSLDRALGISTKARQSVTTRRRPFRASYSR